MNQEPFSGWPPEAFEWFRDLEANNNRDWFQANRRTYDTAVRGPMELFLSEVSEEFGDGKVSRPNRDIRFSADKSPYKIQIYAVVERRGGGGGWYVQLSSEGLFTGGGMWMPDTRTLARIRSAISDDRSGAKLEEVIEQMRSDGLELMQEDSLKTSPRGYAVDHPRIELLRLKHFAAGSFHPPQPWLHNAARDHIVDGWRSVTPLLEWLAAARG
jgi:uncharacterized protein (TIGR02453 family)